MWPVNEKSPTCDVVLRPLLHEKQCSSLQFHLKRNRKVSHSMKKLSTKQITMVALFATLMVILTQFFSIYIPFFGINGSRIGFGHIPLLLAGFLLGPLAGAATGAIGDIIGGIIFPTGGAYFPGFTLTAIVVGLVPGLMKKVAGNRTLKPWMVITGVVIAEIIGAVFMNSLWISMMAGTPFWASFAARAPFSIVKAVVYGVLTAPLYRFLKKAQGLWD